LGAWGEETENSSKKIGQIPQCPLVEFRSDPSGAKMSLKFSERLRLLSL
jgi:hypothetical protein